MRMRFRGLRWFRWFVRTVTGVAQAQAEQTIIDDEHQIFAFYFDVAVRKRIQKVDAFAQQSLDVIAVLLRGQAQQLNKRMSEIIASERVTWIPAILRHNSLGLSPLHVSRWR